MLFLLKPIPDSVLSISCLFLGNWFLRKIVIDACAGLGFKWGVTHGRMESKEQIVQSLRNGIGHISFKWRIKLEAFSTSHLSIFKECLVVLVLLLLITGKSFQFLLISQMGILFFWLVTGIPATIRLVLFWVDSFCEHWKEKL